MLVLNRSYASMLFAHPSLIWATLGFEAFGALWIRKIVNFDY
jgi:Flp pilus assembly protein TadB